MSDILTRLLLNTGDYDTKLAKAKKSSGDFASEIGGKVAGMVGKFAAGIGVAMGGVEAFSKVVSSSQTAGDRYAETMAGMKRGVDEFFTALGTGDFTAFNSGLDGMVARAKEAYRALDQLGNAQMSFDIAQALTQKSIQEGQLAAKNKFAPVDVAKGGFDTWRSGIDEMTARVSQLTLDTQDYIRKAVESVAGVKGFSANMDNITKALLLDIQDKGKRDELKKRYAKEYSEYIEAISDADDLLRTGSKTEAQRMKDTREYNSKMQELNRKYNEAITVNALLVKYGDDELRAIGGNVKSLIGLDSSISNLKREFNETAYEFNNRNKSTTGFVPIESFDGYTVYPGTSDSSIKKGSVSVGAKSNAPKLPVVVGQINYDTPLGKKVLEWMNGKEIPVIKTEIEIEDENIDEEDLSGAWAKHTKRIEDLNSALSSTGEIFGSLGGIMSNFGNDMGAWMLGSMGQIAQMIVQLQSLSTANGVASASKLPFPANLAAIATVVATIASVFSSLPKFADGGIVGGSSYFGDKLLARVNSGEMILNQGQQARLLSMTEGGNVRVTGDVRLNGKDIYISLRNYMSSTGNRL